MIKGYKFQEGSKLTFKQELDSHYTFHSYDEHWNAIWCNVVKSVIKSWRKPIGLPMG